MIRSTQPAAPDHRFRLAEVVVIIAVAVLVLRALFAFGSSPGVAVPGQPGGDAPPVITVPDGNGVDWQVSSFRHSEYPGHYLFVLPRLNASRAASMPIVSPVLLKLDDDQPARSPWGWR